ncbi:transposon Ty3-I Gag-Pol polyprotein [Trichonephila clavata]|uniref:Transposon Ty3-I Gag-Pol polyprotein n=1 Tax=Trichonephila clavata TaxID=2740835 RepID=A0A8X6LUP6_TRICU|nr:transposon Ty3-I Gag-Pol polyprotein [Trichonephila clavata]
MGDNMKISDLSKLITTHPDYDEEFSKNQLVIIIEDRKLPGQQEIENRRLREQQEMVLKQQEIENRRLREQQEMVLKQQEFEKENQRLDREFQLEKLRLENERLKGLTSTPEAKLVNIKCGQTSIKAVIDTGAHISVLREDLIGKDCGEGEGTIQIISAFGEKEIAALKLFNIKIDNGKHGSVPIMCAVSKKLVNDMLISATAYEILLENVQLFDFENQRDFEYTKNKDTQLESEEELSALALGQETETSETNSVKSSFVKLQRMDKSLGPVWTQATNKQDAYWAVPHSTTSVSPYQLVYGWLPNDQLKLLKEAWTGDKEIPTCSSKSIEEYLRDLTKVLKQAHNLVRGNSEKAQAEYASRYNFRSREKRLAVGDRVLVLIPLLSHKLLRKWTGPASIVELPRPHTERVKMKDGSEKELHFNKLRPYVARIEQIGLIFDQDDEFGKLHYAPTDTVELDANDIYNHVMDSSSGLENSQKHQLANLLSKFSDVFSSVPGFSKVKGHSAHLLQTDAFRLGKGVRIP